MASVERRTGSDGKDQWLARWRDPGGQQRSRTFARRKDARDHLTTVEASKLSGTYVDPGRSAVTLGPWAVSWLATQTHLKPSTRARYEGILTRHVVPRWGTTPLAKIGHADVAAWVGGLELAPATTRYVHRVFSLILELAVRDGRITRNPAQGVRLPKVGRSEKRFLTRQEVARLADAAGEYRTLILVLAYCGLRWGEAAALRVGRVDLLRRRLLVAESVTEVRGHLVWGTPKSHAERWVTMPQVLADALMAEVAGKGADDLVFTTPLGRPLRNLNFRRDVFDRATAEAGLPGLTPHELRHTCASLLVQTGANVKAVQQMLGHASAAMTLDVYAGLFSDDLEALASRLDALIAADVYQVCTDAEIMPLIREVN